MQQSSMVVQEVLDVLINCVEILGRRLNKLEAITRKRLKPEEDYKDGAVKTEEPEKG